MSWDALSLFNVVIAAIDIAVAFIIVVLLAAAPFFSRFPVSYRLGLWVGAIGLLGQGVRNILFFGYGGITSG